MGYQRAKAIVLNAAKARAAQMEFKQLLDELYNAKFLSRRGKPLGRSVWQRFNLYSGRLAKSPELGSFGRSYIARARVVLKRAQQADPRHVASEIETAEKLVLRAQEFLN